MKNISHNISNERSMTLFWWWSIDKFSHRENGSWRNNLTPEELSFIEDLDAHFQNENNKDETLKGESPMSYESKSLTQMREEWRQIAKYRGFPLDKYDGYTTSDSDLEECSTYNGCSEKDILYISGNLLNEINKYNRPIFSTPGFLLLIDAINGLSRSLGEGYTPSKELQDKYINVLCSLAQDLISERMNHKQKFLNETLGDCHY